MLLTYTSKLLVSFNIALTIIFVFAYFIAFNSVDESSSEILGSRLMYPSCNYYKLTNRMCGSCGLTRDWIRIIKHKNLSEDYINKNSIKTISASIIIVLFTITEVFLFAYFQYPNNLRLILLSVPIIVLGYAWYDIIITNIHLKTYERLLIF